MRDKQISLNNENIKNDNGEALYVSSLMNSMWWQENIFSIEVMTFILIHTDMYTMNMWVHLKDCMDTHTHTHTHTHRYIF